LSRQKFVLILLILRCNPEPETLNLSNMTTTLLNKAIAAFKQRFFLSREEPKTADEAELKRLFQKRYAEFRFLLAANIRALDIMHELERVLHENRPFGMVFIRSRCTALLTAVYRIIRSLDRLAPDIYRDLTTAFDHIEQQIQDSLESRKLPETTELIMPLDRVQGKHCDLVGPKMANLGELRSALNLNIPKGFVVTTAGYALFFEHNDLQDEINSRIQSAAYDLSGQAQGDLEEKQSSEHTTWLELSSQIQNLIQHADLPPQLLQAIREEFAHHFGLQDDIRISVRSSALGEDTAHSSFAGQYRTVLNVDIEELPQAYKDVVASKYTLQGMTYRYHRGIRDDSVLMGAGCLEMIPAAVSGVLYTCNPTKSQDNSIIITAVFGLPKGVVDGSQPADTFVLDRNTLELHTQHVAHKTEQLVPSRTTGVISTPVLQDLQERPCLSPNEIRRLAQAGLKIETHFAAAQDIEWVITPDDRLVFLQTRPLSLGHGPQKQIQTQVPPLLQGGLTASPGIGSGKVFHVESDADLVLFPDQAIIVSSKSLPKWAPLLSRAVGMITEHGSVAGHLANIAREFTVPAIVGLKGATEQLVNGQVVTLDADAQQVFDGQVDELLEQHAPAAHPMQGSPVFTLLQDVTEHILPLHLVDPERPDFQAINCRTLHDITRFVHEKAVQEMFEFGVRHQFSPRAGKQLKTTVPMQWWILNLEDGFQEEVEGRYVHLNQIQSVPMLALWRGITAIPWQGPPGLDRKGFASILFQATINPELTEAAASNFKVKNYFMISKEFCNLFSRFGFHFSSVEALVGQRIRENYIRFQFKGGAADYFRRVKRTEFVGRLLEIYGFQVLLREDSLVARMDNYEQSFLLQRLKVLGHVIIHTRQLDMIMDNEHTAREYWERMQPELEEVKDLEI
jgi:pyruvate,water dikinase